jgi:glycosyltransferase involved in cell wall biosynthesis
VDVEAIRRWAASHSGRVELIDEYVPVEDVPELFGRARVAVAPYTMGYQSGVIHLAMTMARPVVASDIGDFSSVVIDRETGLLVPPGDPKALCEALDRVLKDAELARSLGAAGRERMLSGSSWESVAEKVEAALLAIA